MDAFPPAGPWDSCGHADVPSGKIAWASYAAGRPVILLHKLGGWIADWRYLAEAMPSGYRLIALDLAGHGASENTPPADSWHYPLETSAADVTAALDSLGVRRADFVGNSLGGCVAAILAAQQPDRVRSLTLMSCATGGPATKEAMDKTDEREKDWFDADGNPVPRSFETMQKIAGLQDPQIADEQNQSRAAAGRWIQWSERGVGVADIAGALTKVTAPTLLVYGERDPLIRNFEGPALANLSNGRAVHIAGAGRFPQLESPKGTAAAIAEFLSAV